MKFRQWLGSNATPLELGIALVVLCLFALLAVVI